MSLSANTGSVLRLPSVQLPGDGCAEDGQLLLQALPSGFSARSPPPYARTPVRGSYRNWGGKSLASALSEQAARDPPSPPSAPAGRCGNGLPLTFPHRTTCCRRCNCTWWAAANFGRGLELEAAPVAGSPLTMLRGLQMYMLEVHV